MFLTQMASYMQFHCNSYIDDLVFLFLATLFEEEVLEPLLKIYGLEKRRVEEWGSSSNFLIIDKSGRGIFGYLINKNS